MTHRLTGNRTYGISLSQPQRHIPVRTSNKPDITGVLDEEDANDFARMLAAIADPTRLRILDILNKHPGTYCVWEIVKYFTLEQPTISHHLRLLLDAGLVGRTKKGLEAYYYPRYKNIRKAGALMAYLVTGEEDSDV